MRSRVKARALRRVLPYAFCRRAKPEPAMLVYTASSNHAPAIAFCGQSCLDCFEVQMTITPRTKLIKFLNVKGVQHEVTPFTLYWNMRYVYGVPWKVADDHWER